MGGAKHERRLTSRHLSNSIVAVVGLLIVQEASGVSFTLAEGGSDLPACSGHIFNCVEVMPVLGENKGCLFFRRLPCQLIVVKEEGNVSSQNRTHVRKSREPLSYASVFFST